LIGERRLVVIGHSLGGAILTKLCKNKDLTKKIAALIIIDIVEETVLSSIPTMAGVIQTWPNHFATAQDCIEWSTRIR
jgi:protein phosphatase methylesterase 1